MSGSKGLEEEWALMDEEEDEENELLFDEDIDEDSFNVEGDQTNYTLNDIARAVRDFMSESGRGIEIVRNNLIEVEMVKIKGSLSGVEDLLLASNEDDTEYNELLIDMYPRLEKHLSKLHSDDSRQELIETMGLAFANMVELDIQEDDLEDSPEEGEKEEEKENQNKVEANSMEVLSIVNDIMNVYESLYAPCFVNKPLGILSSDGVYTLDDSGKVVKVDTGSYGVRLYDAIKDHSKGYLPNKTTTKDIDSSFLSSTGELLEVYSPMFHLRNIYGLKSDGSFEKRWLAYKDILRKDISNKVASVLSKIEGDTIKVQLALKEMFTNCIIIEQLDRTMYLQIRHRVANSQAGLGSHIIKKSKEIFASDTCMLINESSDNQLVQSTLMVFDEKAYKNDILFAYKAYEKLMQSGVKPSASQVILGRGIDGVDITENFSDAGNIIIGIVAGSRSGKGVLTLNILASLYSDDCPTYYLDFKPDMSATLWEMERELRFKGHNARIFAIDGLLDQRSDGDQIVRPVRKYPYGLRAPSDLRLETEDFAIVPYLKALQFSVVLSDLRSMGLLGKEQKLFFVLDEAQKANDRLAILLKKLMDVESTNKPKKGEQENDKYKYAKRFIDVFHQDLRSGMSKVANTTGGVGRVGLIVLGQKIDPVEWRLGEMGDWRKSLFGNLVANMNIKLIGRDSGNSPSYGLPSKKFKGSEFRDDRGYFVRFRGAKTPEDLSTLEMIKTYLVLNKNDFNYDKYLDGILPKSTFTGSLLNNIADDNTRHNVATRDFLDENGNIRESIGFSGLMKLIMGGDNDAELARKMSIGYNLLEEVFNRMGLNKTYETIEEYLYDCSYESIFSVSELIDMYKNGGGVENNQENEQEDRPNDGVDWFNDIQETPSPPNNNTESVIGYDRNMKPVTVPNNNNNVDGIIDQHGGNEQEYPDFRPIEPTPVLQQPVNQQQTVYTDEYHNYKGVYDEEIMVAQSPFNVYGTSRRPTSMINSIRMMSGVLLSEMTKIVGDLSRVHSFEATGTGIVINDIAFRPKFNEDFITSLPFELRNQVERGNLVELFHFENLKSFKNLQVFSVDNSRLAEGRIRMELGLSPRKSWNVLFNKFHYLQEVIIGGVRIDSQETADNYDRNGRGGFDLTENLRKALNVGHGVVSSSRMSKVWDSKPVKVMAKAGGWTLAIKGVSVAASLFGPWGLLFGGLAAVSTYNEFKKRKGK